jgi:hypothetical protein
LKSIKHVRLTKFHKDNYNTSNINVFLVSVQNGSIHQKDAVNDDDFEPYLSSQTNQVSFLIVLNFRKLKFILVLTCFFS